jgi:glycosyltransferase involved in cell wall biosynthesis
MITNNKVSIVTICYNCVGEIENTIKSVIAQTYQNREYLIIDGASKDGTLDIVNKYKTDIDYILSEPDHGIYDAMNKGLMKASGDWIIFMNAGDNFYDETVLSKFMKCINNETIIAYGDVMNIGSFYKYRSLADKLSNMDKYMTVHHQSTFTRLDYHKKHPFNLAYHLSADYDFFYHAYFRDNVKFQYIPQIVANFDRSGISSSNFRKSYAEDLKIWGKENDTLFKLKMNAKMSSWEIKLKIKQLFMNQAQLKQLEYIKLVKAGFEPIEL